MRNFMKKRINKRGLTLVEILVACFILVVTIAALISIIAFSNAMTAKNIIQDSGYAEAEGIADILVTALSGGTTATTDLNSMTGAVYVASTSAFSPAPNAKQYTFVDYNQSGITGHTIYVRVYDSKGALEASVTAFASDTGGALN